MVAAITIVAEQKLVVVFARTTKRAGLAFNALPGVFSHGNNHIVRELKAGGMAY